jgi:N-acetylneuraminic acid mutarotase
MTAIRSGGTYRPDAKSHTLTLLRDGRVLAVGGDSDAMGRAELYDPVTRSWTTTGNLITPRFNHSATLLPNGKVLIAGGARVFGRGCSLLDDAERAELFDPATGRWSAAANMTTPRAGHAAILLPNGMLLVAGVAGGSACDGLASSELYDPVRDRWTALGSLKKAAIPLQAVLLKKGKVLAVGGKWSGADLFESSGGK